MKVAPRALLSSMAALTLAIVSCTAFGSETNALPPATQVPSDQAPTAAEPAATTAGTVSPPALDIQQVGAALDATVPPALQPNGATACSIAVVYRGAGSAPLQTAFFNYGTLSKSVQTPVDSNTEYEIGSLTKLFTADLLAFYVGQGSMNLDDPLQKYLPAEVHVPTYQGKFITLRELATHTSGLPRTLPHDGLRKVNGVSFYGVASDEEIFTFLDSYQLTRAPGSKWEYSNLANGILGIAEETVGGSGYEQLTVTNILTPLGLADTRITLGADQRARLAASYTSKGQTVAAIAETGGLLGAGAFRSTAHDMALFLAANMQPDSSPLASVIELTQRRQDRGGAPGDAMGLGWLITKAGTPQEQFNKSGSTLGYNSYITFWPATSTGYVLLCNGHPVSDLGTALNKLIGGGQAAFDDSE